MFFSEVQALLSMERYKLGSMSKFFLVQGVLVYMEALLERQAMQVPTAKAILEKLPFRFQVWQHLRWPDSRESIRRFARIA